MRQDTKKVMAALKDEFGVITRIPSEIGRYDSRPIFQRDITLKSAKNIHVAERSIDGINYLVRQYSPSFRQKDTKGYFYIVYWNILAD